MQASRGKLGPLSDMGKADTKIFIVGAGGHAAEVASYLNDLRKSDGSVRLGGAVDDTKPTGPWHLTEILGSVDSMSDYCHPTGTCDVAYIVAVGSNELRKRLVRRITDFGITNLRPFTLRHPYAQIGATVEVAGGTLLAPSAIVTTRVRLGAHCILNVKASVSHDCRIGDYCNINPGAILCGDVQLGEGCYIGAGATIIEKRKIGAWTVVGAGAVVTQDLPDGVTAIGIPARIVRRRGELMPRE